MMSDETEITLAEQIAWLASERECLADSILHSPEVRRERRYNRMRIDAILATLRRVEAMERALREIVGLTDPALTSRVSSYEVYLRAAAALEPKVEATK